MRRPDFILKYRVRNWPAYGRASVPRGRTTAWLDEQPVSSWRLHRHPEGRGRPRIDSDTASKCTLVVTAVFHLSLRATQGFLESVVRLMLVALPVPDDMTDQPTTISRRQGGLAA